MTRDATTEVRLRQLAERGRAASNVHEPLPREPYASRAYEPPRCPACRCAAAEQVKLEDANGARVYVRTGVLLCFHCDQLFVPAQPTGWYARGPIPPKTGEARA